MKPSQGSWLWLHGGSPPNFYAEFRCAFHLTTAAGEAEILLSATTSYRLFVNGRRVGWGPPREVPPYFYVDRIGLAPLLVPGSNVIELTVHHQGVNSHTHQAGPAAFFAGGRVGEVSFENPDLWQGRRIARYQAHSNRFSTCVGFREEVDFSACELPWEEVQRVSRHPWQMLPTLLERDLPPLTETLRDVQTLTPFAGGWLADFGEEVFGFVVLEFTCENAVTVEVQYAEILDAGRVNPRRHPAVDARDVLRAPAGAHAWFSYEKRAFRYLWIDSPVHVRRLRVMESSPWNHLSLDRSGADWAARAATEDGRRINRILEVSARTILLNLDDLVTDCPWRERAQYFDIFFWSTPLLKLLGTSAPIRRFLRQYARGANKEGVLRMCYPSPGDFAVIPDFAMLYAVQLDAYGTMTGDWDTPRELMHCAGASVARWHAYEQEGLLVNPPGWIFLDNSPDFSRYPRSAALNAVYAGAHEALSRLHTRFGNPESAKAAHARFENVRAAWRRTFLRGNRILDSDAVPEIESWRQWSYHHQAAADDWNAPPCDHSFFLRLTLRHRQATPFELAFVWPEAGRVWLDGRLIAVPVTTGPEKQFRFHPAHIDSTGSWHSLLIEAPLHLWDCSVNLASRNDLDISPGLVWVDRTSTETTPMPPSPHERARRVELRPWTYPFLSQATVGYAAFHGMLDAPEAVAFLRAALADEYHLPWQKWASPFFCKETADPELLARRILPAWVPSAAYHFVHSLQRFGLHAEARTYLRMIYDGMLERGATTWWEEWQSRSSNCHAWATFGVHLLAGE